MKNIFLISLLLLGCSSSPKSNGRQTFSLKEVQELQVGQTTSQNIEKVFGKPTTISNADGIATWTYNDNETNYQRLTLGFGQSTKLQSIIWIPKPNEDEANLEKALQEFPKSNFHKIASADSNPHTLSTMYSYVDENSGVTLLYQDGRDLIEAIIWTDKTRGPATFKETTTQVPHTIGN